MNGDITTYSPRNIIDFCNKLCQLGKQDSLELQENLPVIVTGHNLESFDQEKLSITLQVLIRCFKEQVSLENSENLFSALSYLKNHYSKLDKEKLVLQLEKGAKKIEKFVKLLGEFAVLKKDEQTDEGNACSQFDLAVFYLEDEKDLEQAAKYFELAANQGNQDAQYNLALCYEKGIGVQIDFSKAAEWFEKVAALGDAKSQFYLANYYQEGKGVRKDERRAANLYELSANQDYVPAQYNLANCYAVGVGFAQDLGKAFEWYKRAADQGNADAQIKVAEFLFDGRGVEQDKKQALEICTKLAYQGNVDVQNFLGEMYLNGEESFVQRDSAKAATFLWQAARQGDDSAKELLEGIERLY